MGTAMAYPDGPSVTRLVLGAAIDGFIKPTTLAWMTATIRQKLEGVRTPLLELHKALVDSERVSYEEIVGQIRSPNHFLQLLTTDPWFAWLHPLSQLIVSIDEALDRKEPLTPAEVDAVFTQVQRLLVASEIGEGFSRHYFDALQRDPGVVLAHAAVTRQWRPRT